MRPAVPVRTRTVVQVRVQKSFSMTREIRCAVSSGGPPSYKVLGYQGLHEKGILIAASFGRMLACQADVPSAYQRNNRLEFTAGSCVQMATVIQRRSVGEISNGAGGTGAGFRGRIVLDRVA